jgi:hypothetical protein
VVASEKGRAATKAVLNSALKVAKSKPAMTLATGVVCIYCVPVAGACTSAYTCAGFGIIIAKTLG